MRGIFLTCLVVALTTAGIGPASHGSASTDSADSDKVVILTHQGNSPGAMKEDGLATGLATRYVPERDSLAFSNVVTYVWQDNFLTYASCMSMRSYILTLPQVATAWCSSTTKWNGTAWRYWLYYTPTCTDRIAPATREA